MLIGYARVSTDDQDSALQRDALTEAGCEKIFDETMSEARADRPQLRAALDFARKGDVLVVWKLDLLARSLTQLIDAFEELQERGIGFRSLTETIDATSAGGRLIFHIFGALAEFERAIIRERTKAGLRAARDPGRAGCRLRLRRRRQPHRARVAGREGRGLSIRRAQPADRRRLRERQPRGLQLRHPGVRRGPP